MVSSVFVPDFGREVAEGCGEERAYDAGYVLGQKHAKIGDVRDFSDERCKPLIAEADTEAARFGPFASRGNGQFHAGYHDGYSFALYEMGLTISDLGE